MYMALDIRVVAPAKINLNLKVLPPRDDGFHGIESIFQAVSLQDVLYIRPVLGKGQCLCCCDAMELPLDNTLVRAYKAFESVTGIQMPSVSVHVEKHIPAGGGLGGGSSDAAALVRGLEKLAGVKLSVSQCNDIAALVGSDVFFFFSLDENGRGAALVSGRGEIVQNIDFRSDLYYLMILPGVNSSTKEAYSLVDQQYSELEKLSFPSFERLREIYALPPQQWNFKNSFTAVLMEKYKSIAQALKLVNEAGASFADMSGSGSTVFGVFSTRESAENAMGLVKGKYYCVIAQ